MVKVYQSSAHLFCVLNLVGFSVRKDDLECGVDDGEQEKLKLFYLFFRRIRRSYSSFYNVENPKVGRSIVV